MAEVRVDQATFCDKLTPSLISAGLRERHYTYVDAAKVASPNPGYCFQVAGWHKCGKTKSGLIVLEKLNEPERDAETQAGWVAGSLQH